MNYEELFADESICIRSNQKKLYVKLMGEERENAVSDLTHSINRKRDIEDKKKAQDKIWSDQIKAEDSYIYNAGEKLEDGVLRDVDCKEFIFWKKGKVIVVRTDTGEIIQERDITSNDQPQTTDTTLTPAEFPEEFRQKILALEDKTEKPEAQDADFEVVDDADAASEATGEQDAVDQEPSDPSTEVATKTEAA